MSHSGTALLNPYKIFADIKLAKGMRVADLGCGRTGHFVFPAAKTVGDTGIVYGVDVMKDVLENIKSTARAEGCANVQTVWSDLERAGKTPLPPASVDACFFVNVLFQVKDKRSAIAEAARLLKKQGHLVIIDWQKKLGMLGPAPGQMLIIDTLVDLAGQSMLKLAKQFQASDYHFGLIFAKE
ncbi:methyltransferase domain-containing protein [Patescibacteria group bacterium]|nr:MAG: methyltransferase domain-containing protein [Patescibacteria group bacterium]